MKLLRECIRLLVEEENYEYTTTIKHGINIVYRCENTEANAQRLLKSFKNKTFGSNSYTEHMGLFVTTDYKNWCLGSIVVLRLTVKMNKIYSTDTTLETFSEYDDAKEQKCDTVVSIPPEDHEPDQILLLDPNKQVLKMEVYKTFETKQWDVLDKFTKPTLTMKQ